MASAKIITDRQTGQPRGFGFVEMETKVEAQKAISMLNGRTVEGRPLTVNEARPQQKSSFGGGRRGAAAAAATAGAAVTARGGDDWRGAVRPPSLINNNNVGATLGAALLVVRAGSPPPIAWPLSGMCPLPRPPGSRRRRWWRNKRAAPLPR